MLDPLAELTSSSRNERFSYRKTDRSRLARLARRRRVGDIKDKTCKV